MSDDTRTAIAACLLVGLLTGSVGFVAGLAQPRYGDPRWDPHTMSTSYLYRTREVEIFGLQLDKGPASPALVTGESLPGGPWARWTLTYYAKVLPQVSTGQDRFDSTESLRAACRAAVRVAETP